MTDPKIAQYNGPMLTEEDRRAHKSWATNGTVDQQYILKTLGDPAVTFVPQMIPVRVLSADDLQGMDCPFPPEPGYTR